MPKPEVLDNDSLDLQRLTGGVSFHPVANPISSLCLQIHIAPQLPS
jgi:hypothetical protein